jgi:hypothetical protein
MPKNDGKRLPAMRLYVAPDTMEWSVGRGPRLLVGICPKGELHCSKYPFRIHKYKHSVSVSEHERHFTVLCSSNPVKDRRLARD